MKAKIGACMALTGGLAAAFVLALSAPAFAHEERTVGAYQIVVGWGDEPAYAGQKNSVQLILATKAGKPVLNLGDSLKVEVVFGEQQMELSFEPAFDVEEGFGTPGDYRAWIIPTTPGTYTFHLVGAIGKQKVDERFTSGPTTFDDVADPAEVEFPTKVPTGTELSERLDREIPRVNAAIASARSQAEDRADTARTLAVVGIVIGAVGLLLAVVALIGWRAGAHRSTPPVSVGRGAESRS
jgi:lipoprotein-anchoring transpeptidase ErfK/SrfK